VVIKFLKLKKMTREQFIRKWLGTGKPYTECYRDEMREDLDKLLSQKSVKLEEEFIDLKKGPDTH
jgi:hypothetical protein